MTFRIVYTPGYNRRAARFLKRHPEVQAQYEQALRLLELNPFHPSLRLRRLRGPLAELHAASITVSYRITLELMLLDQQIIPIDVGGHDEVYR